MKIATLRHRDRTVLAAIDPEQRTARVLMADGQPLSDLNALIEAGTAPGLAATGDTLPWDAVQWLAPIPRPRRNVLCVGKNYREHAHEFTRSGFDSSATQPADAIPTAPIVFTKMPETVVGPGAAVRYPEGVSDQLDYEAELGVVIGRGGRGIRREDAMDHVFGYVIVNDVTARDLQATHKQWFLGKSMDDFCPMGPWIATADELDGARLDVKCWINGELRQNANTRDLIFDIPTLIATISAGLSLRPGDIIATGTPAGVGIGFSPPRFLRRGDRMDIEITGLGRLSNTIG